MNYPDIALAATMLHVLRQAIAANEDVEVIFLATDASLALYEVKFDPPLSATMALSDYDENLPKWKEQFVEKARMFSTPNFLRLVGIGYEIGQLASWLMGTLPNMNELPDVDSRKVKALESMEVIKGLCTECKDPVAVTEMLEKTADAIRTSTNMGDLENAANTILDWKENNAMFMMK